MLRILDEARSHFSVFSGADAMQVSTAALPASLHRRPVPKQQRRGDWGRAGRTFSNPRCVKDMGAQAVMQAAYEEVLPCLQLEADRRLSL